MSAPLLSTQRRFLAAILEPLTGEDRSLAELPAGESSASDRFNTTADALLRSTPSVHARERLGLYQRQYWFRILDSLAEDFPRLRSLLGADCYHATAERYLLAQPPSSWTLRHLGAGFAAFLRRDETLAPSLRPWAAALAEFEYAHMKVFAAATAPVPTDANLVEGRLTLSASVELVLTDRPLSRLLSRDDFQVPAENRARRELHVVWRTAGYALRARREPLALLPLLRSLQRGGSLETIIAGARPLPSPAVTRAAFARWRELGWIALGSGPSLATPVTS